MKTTNVTGTLDLGDAPALMKARGNSNSLTARRQDADAPGSRRGTSPLRVGRALCSALVLLLAGAAIPVQAAGTVNVEVIARDARLFPERLDVPAGVKLRLSLRNEGKVPVEFESLELRVEKVVPPDGAATVTVQALKPGSYTLIDEFHAETGKMLIIAK